MDLFNTLSDALKPSKQLDNYELSKQLRLCESKVLQFEEMAERTNSSSVKKQALKDAEKYQLKLDSLRIELNEIKNRI